MKQQKRRFKVRIKQTAVPFGGESLENILASRRQIMNLLLARATNEKRRQEIKATFQKGDERFRRMFAASSHTGRSPA